MFSFLTRRITLPSGEDTTLPKGDTVPPNDDALPSSNEITPLSEYTEVDNNNNNAPPQEMPCTPTPCTPCTPRALVASASAPNLSLPPPTKHIHAAEQRAKKKAKRHKQKVAAKKERCRLETELADALEAVTASDHAVASSGKQLSLRLNANARDVFDAERSQKSMEKETNDLSEQMSSMKANFDAAHAELNEARDLTASVTGRAAMNTATADFEIDHRRKAHVLACLTKTMWLGKCHSRNKHLKILKTTAEATVDQFLHLLETLLQQNKLLYNHNSVNQDVAFVAGLFKDVKFDPKYKHLLTASSKSYKHVLDNKTTDAETYSDALLPFTNDEMRRGSFVPFGERYALFTHPDTRNATILPRQPIIESYLKKPSASGLPRGARKSTTASCQVSLAQVGLACARGGLEFFGKSFGGRGGGEEMQSVNKFKLALQDGSILEILTGEDAEAIHSVLMENLAEIDEKDFAALLDSKLFDMPVDWKKSVV